MNDTSIADLASRLGRLEDESAIQRLIMSYGPAADAGLAEFAGRIWLDEGTYDWDASGEPHQGSAGVAAMLQTDGHRHLISEGAAHFAGPLVVDVQGDTAIALNYSLIMRRDEKRFYLWRVSAVRWELERAGPSWRVRTRTNRLLDASGAGRELFGQTLRELFGEGPP